jgi:hypothetical protein
MTSHPYQKGTDVTHSEQIAKARLTESGLFSTLGTCLHRQGSGTPTGTRRPTPRTLSHVLLLTALALLLAAPVALAAPSKPRGSFCLNGITPECLSPTNITPTSFTLHNSLVPNGAETHWRYEYSTASESGPWTLGPQGVIPASEADENIHDVVGQFTGLTPATRYYIRFSAENEVGSESVPVASLETAAPPTSSAFVTHTFDAGSETIRVLGSISPNTTPLNEVQTVTIEGAPTGGTFTLTIDGETTTSLPVDASALELRNALDALPISAKIDTNGETGTFYLSGPHGGPYRVEFAAGLGGSDQPLLTANASGLTPSGTVSVAAVQVGSNPQTHYHLQYVSQEQFEKPGAEGGWAHAQSTTELDAGGGSGHLEDNGVVGKVPIRFIFDSELVSADLPGLLRGETYHYRVVAGNEAGVARSPERTLSVPAPPESSPELCPNESFRTGPSAILPDCRAYEQVTPVDKEATTEVAHYGAALFNYRMVGEDGNHFLLTDSTAKFGADSDSGESSFRFSREPQGGWQIASATPQPETGVNSDEIRLQNPDFSEVALEVGWETAPHRSSAVTLETGPFGGPYTPVVTMPRADVPEYVDGKGHFTTWLAASADFSKLVFWSDDRTLLARHSTTVSGPDLYEYSGGQMRQVNVLGDGATIGSCGAQMVTGFEEAGTQGEFVPKTFSSPHAISADGRRVFFDAAPGSSCPTKAELEQGGGPNLNLYMRLDGGEADAETLDIGAYRFLGANSAGSELLLERESDFTHETVLYDTETRAAKRLFSTSYALGEGNTFLSADFTALYFASEDQLLPEAPTGIEHIYRYDLSNETLQLALPAGIGNVGAGEGRGSSVSPDGRYFYFATTAVPDVPGGAGSQVYRYDSVEGVVECMSCASPFDPNPKLESTFFDTQEGTGDTVNRVPNATFASANGDYVFFDALSALVPADVDGEIAPEGIEGEHSSPIFSASSDVYEWRKDGIDGCALGQGCLSLISSGQGGVKVMLLGTEPSGRNVFFTTTSQLLPQDTDTSFDIYDARIDGGFAEPSHPVECEGDSCSTPFAVPSEATPSSATFHGAGDVQVTTLKATLKPKAKKKPRKTKAKRKTRKAKPRRKSVKHAGKASDRRKGE